MSMISDLVERLRTEAKSMGTYGTDYMATLLTRSADTIEMLSEKAREPKRGEWIAVSSYDAFGGSEELWNAHGNPTAFHYCSKCKAQSYVNEFGEELLTDFCPNCGARMKGADDEVR